MTSRPDRPAAPMRAWVAVVVALSGLPSTGWDVVHRDRVTLEVRALVPGIPQGSTDRLHELPLDIESRGELEFPIRWPDAETTSRVKLAVSPWPAPTGRDLGARIDASVELPDGRRATARREVGLSVGSTALVEILRAGGRSVTLALQPSTSRETVVAERPTVGAPVRFRIEVQAVAEGKAVAVERNVLDSFVGQSVSYAFSLGSTPDADALELRLLPVRILGEIVEVETALIGKLGSEDGPSVKGDSSRWFMSRGASSTVGFETGDPPRGYRFVVTPDY